MVGDEEGAKIVEGVDRQLPFALHEEVLEEVCQECDRLGVWITIWTLGEAGRGGAQR